MNDNNNQLLILVFQTANEMAYWMNITPKINDIEIREKDYNRFKSYMRESLQYNNEHAIRYRNAMETLFSKMKIEKDPFFGDIYIAKWNDYNDALAVLVELEMTI